LFAEDKKENSKKMEFLIQNMDSSPSNIKNYVGAVYEALRSVRALFKNGIKCRILCTILMIKAQFEVEIKSK